MLRSRRQSASNGRAVATPARRSHLKRDDRDQALTWLEKGCSDRDVWALNFKVDPIYADLRTDARFVALLRRVGLEQ